MAHEMIICLLVERTLELAVADGFAAKERAIVGRSLGILDRCKSVLFFTRAEPSRLRLFVFVCGGRRGGMAKGDGLGDDPIRVSEAGACHPRGLVGGGLFAKIRAPDSITPDAFP